MYGMCNFIYHTWLRFKRNAHNSCGVVHALLVFKVMTCFDMKYEAWNKLVSFAMLFWWDLHNYLLCCTSVASQGLEVWKLIKSSPSGVLTAVLFRSRLPSPSTWKLMWQSAPSGSTSWTACRVAGPLTAARRFSSAATQPAAPATTSHTSPSSCRPGEPMWASQAKTPHLIKKYIFIYLFTL